MPVFLTLLAFLLILPANAARADTESYRLGSGDKLDIRAIYWDERQLAFVPWTGISGTYAVNGDGAVMLPLAGTITARGRSLAELTADLSARLQDSTKLLERPSVAVDIVEYAPLFVVGDVANPGRYEALPGATAAQALALAGGAMRMDIGMADLRGMLRDTGTLAQIDRDFVRNQVRAARLTAELAGADALELPDGLSHPDGRTALETLLREESAVFEARRRARALETENLEELKALLGTEIASLKSKRSGLETQAALARENLSNVEALRESGLARSIQIREAQRAIYELDTQDIDIQTGIFRAQQRIQEAERDILSIGNRLTTDATGELQQVNAAQEELAMQRSVMGGLLRLSGSDAPLLSAEVRTLYHLMRDGTETEVAPATPLRAGDVIRIERVVDGAGG